MKLMQDQPLPFNPAVLRWAREWAGWSVDRAARKVGKPAAVVAAWEDDGDVRLPTVGQARKLADAYGRPFMEFFRTAVPDIRRPGQIPDFRLDRSADPAETAALRDIQQWAEAARESALDLFAELGEEPPRFPDGLRASVRADPEAAAEQARQALGVTPPE